MKADRIVVITGAGGGMGKLAVERFLGNGDTVVANDTAEAAGALIGAIVVLASPDADVISGQTVNVDGGKHML